MGDRDPQEQEVPSHGSATALARERMADYLADDHPRAAEPTAPLWPSATTAAGTARRERYAVPLDWSQPLALGTFYDTIVKPALEAVGLPASRPARLSRPR